MTIANRIRSSLWIGPALIVAPFLMGANGNGCGGEVFTGNDGGSTHQPGGDSGGGPEGCMPADWCRTLLCRPSRRGARTAAR